MTANPTARSRHSACVLKSEFCAASTNNSSFPHLLRFNHHLPKPIAIYISIHGPEAGDGPVVGKIEAACNSMHKKRSLM